MQNVVLDTNLLVSAFLTSAPGSRSVRALHLARVHCTICLSDALEAEVRDVLLRPKFRRYGATPETVGIFLDTLTAGAIRAVPGETVTDCRDPGDNIILEAALAGGAVMIVTGDADLLALHPWRGIAVLSPADFVACFGSP